ncbi:MAG: hypothetical protein ACODAU_09085 [Myxococcota bacterium]
MRPGRSLHAPGALAAVILLGAVVMPARATVMVEVPIEEMARQADGIVHGRVTRTGTRMVVRDGSLDPHTLVWIRVDRWLAGSGGGEVVVRELGGVGEVTALGRDGAPRYEAGEEVVAFLEPHAGGMRTLAMAQGKFTVVRGRPDEPARVRRDLRGIGFARFDAKGTTVEDAPRHPTMPFDELVRVIELARGQRGATGGSDGEGAK